VNYLWHLGACMVTSGSESGSFSTRHWFTFHPAPLMCRAGRSGANDLSALGAKMPTVQVYRNLFANLVLGRTRLAAMLYIHDAVFCGCKVLARLHFCGRSLYPPKLLGRSRIQTHILTVPNLCNQGLSWPLLMEKVHQQHSTHNQSTNRCNLCPREDSKHKIATKKSRSPPQYHNKCLPQQLCDR